MGVRLDSKAKDPQSDFVAQPPHVVSGHLLHHVIYELCNRFSSRNRRRLRQKTHSVFRPHPRNRCIVHPLVCFEELHVKRFDLLPCNLRGRTVRLPNRNRPTAPASHHIGNQPQCNHHSQRGHRQRNTPLSHKTFPSLHSSIPMSGEPTLREFGV